ncbi:oxaloacetate tautomerase fahd-1, mitochondrial-like [Clavelina lepadiformis]|uniref:Oxaloacetate tautomerase FAHD1, mitochondrial n=1 Tax=Clavelina lepadiformis TaxID=159417 RepID=A0ABP0EXC8_CLALP
MQNNLSRFSEWGRKVVCVGRNFKDHCVELSNPIPKEPLIFLKPTSSYVVEGESIKIPNGCNSLHHEVELGVVISKDGSNILENSAMDYVGGYVLALDMTARDWQDKAKKQGKPWSFAKGFDTACPISSLIPRGDIVNPDDVGLWLKVNGVEKQNGSTKDMIFNIPSLISYISHVMTLERGDVVLTGTPEGVGPVEAGDVIECGVNNLLTMKFNVMKKFQS